MVKKILPGLALSALLTAGAVAAPNTEATHVRATAGALNPRTIHAGLRYDASTAAGCRSLSDASTEVCLLLALHVIRMSQRTPAQGPL